MQLCEIAYMMNITSTSKVNAIKKDKHESERGWIRITKACEDEDVFQCSLP
jgi:hypothetical protein